MSRLVRQVLLSFLLSLSLLPVVLAQQAASARFGRALSYVFDLPDSPYFSLYIKFAYFILILSALHFGAQRGFKDAYTKPLRAFVVVVSLMGAIGTPTSIVLFIYEMYTAVISVGLALIPIIIGFLINQRLLNDPHDRFQAFLRALIYILLVIVTFFLSNHLANLSGPNSQVYNAIADVLYWAGIIALIGAIWNLLSALVGGNPAAAAWNAVRGHPTPHGPAPHTPPAPNTPPAHGFSITRVTPNSAPQDAGRITLHVEGTGLDHIAALHFPFHTDHTQQPLHLVSNAQQHTATSFDIDVDVSLDHNNNPTNLGHYDCHAEDNAHNVADLPNCFEILAPGGGHGGAGQGGGHGNHQQAQQALQQIGQLAQTLNTLHQQIRTDGNVILTTQQQNPNQNLNQQRTAFQQVVAQAEPLRQQFNHALQTILNTGTLNQFTPQERQNLVDAIDVVAIELSNVYNYTVNYEIHFLTRAGPV